MNQRMNVTKRNVFQALIAAGLFLAHSSAMAITIPTAPTSPTGYDEIRTADGVTCRSTIGGNLQVYGGALDISGNQANVNTLFTPDYDERGGFVGFAYSFGGSERLRCDRLAEIETERAQIELARLKDEIELLKKARQLQLLGDEGVLPKLTRE